MQQLAAHFNKKKAEFVNFFTGILQVIQKLSYDIQLQIDREYQQTVTEFRDLHPQKVDSVFMSVEKDRAKVYHEMINRLYATLKNFANQIGNEQTHEGALIQPHKFKIQEVTKQPQERKNILNTILLSDNEKTPSEPNEMVRSNSQFNSSSQTIQLNPKQNPIKPPVIQPLINHTPSPFAQKLKLNLLKQSQTPNVQSPTTQRAKQKLQIIKKTDICQSLDNYLNKEAKQMLKRSQSKHNQYSKSRKSLNKKYDTPQRNKYNNQNYQSSESNMEKRIEEKLGGLNDSSGKYNTVGVNRKLPGESMISPIQRYKLD